MYGLDKNAPADAALDLDNDGLTNLAEYRGLTDPTKSDTDGDGLKDGVETNTGVWKSASDTGTNPFKPDTDGDLLKDGVETNTGTFVSASDTGTNPLVKDTDGDKFDDAVEVALGSDPTRASNTPAVDPAKPSLLAYWDFNDASDPAKAVDKVHGFVGNVISNAVYTPDQGGWTGQVGDLAMDFGADGAGEAVIIPVVWLGAVAAYDQVTVSFRQRLYEIADSACFWAVSPSSSGSMRGFSAHTPWSNNNLYFDTAGCCDGATQRINAGIATFADYSGDVGWWTDWHHFVFLKKGSLKQIWIDGKLFLQGTNTARLPADFIELQLGLDAPDGFKSLRGIMDDFALYASALAPEQIAELYAGKSPLAIQPLTFAITRVALAAATQTLEIAFESSPGIRYTILQSSDLKGWTSAGQIDGAAGAATTTYSTAVVTTPGGFFYRVQR